MYEIKIDVSDIIKMSQRFEIDLPNLHMSTMRSIMNLLKVKLLSKLPIVFGNLVNSIQTSVDFVSLGGIVTQADVIIIGELFIGRKGFVTGTPPSWYAEYLENGTNPNVNVPYEPILRWVRQKFGISDKKKLFAATRGVVRKIQTIGTIKYSYFQKLFNETQGQVVSIYRMAILRFVNSVNSGI